MDTGDHINVRMLGEPFRIRTTKGTLHFGGGCVEVRPKGKNGFNFCSIAIRPHDHLPERITRLNELLDRRPSFDGAVVTLEPLTRKEASRWLGA